MDPEKHPHKEDQSEDIRQANQRSTNAKRSGVKSYLKNKTTIESKNER